MRRTAILAVLLALVTPATSIAANPVRISQVFGGGGNAGAPWNQDFVELFNASSVPVDISNWSLQYASLSGTFQPTNAVLIPPGSVIPACGYFLIGLAPGPQGAPLPPPDMVGVVNMSQVNGKVLLYAGVPTLNTCTGNVIPEPPLWIDMVGYGTASCFETAAAPALTVSTAAVRAGDGLQDSDHNANDFTAVSAFSITPRNSAMGTNPGCALTTQPTIELGFPGTCVAVATPCLTIPVTIVHGSSPLLRAYSVSLQLSPGLQLCGAIQSGGYLGNPSFHVIDHGGGSYTVDEATLGTTCGATGTGTLFTLPVTGSVPNGVGSVTITSVLLRDCANQPVPVTIGAPQNVTIDLEAPAAVTALAATQDKSGNDTDGTTKIDLSWPAVEAGGHLDLYRAPFGNYPEYDDAPGAGAVPATPSYPPGAPWTHVATVNTVTAIADEVATRDVWYYVGFVKDACGNVSPVSNRTSGTLNYHLGDVHNTLANCAGDNQVGTPDLSYLGSQYGAILGVSDARACLDVGPTTDFTTDGRPTTDNQIQFEDFVMLAIGYGDVSKTRVAVAGAATDELEVKGPAQVAAGEQFAVTLRMRGTGAVQGLSTTLAWNEAVAEPLGVAAGAWLAALDGVALSPGGGVVDAAVLGTGMGLRGEGDLASVRFRARAAGAPQVTLARIDARDAANRPRPVAGVAERPELPAPVRTALGIAAPNPLTASTTVSLSLARSGRVKLAAYDLTGRLVRVLVDAELGAGTRAVTWDGRSEAGAKVAPGTYVLRLEAGEIVQSRQVRVLR